ncbi:hypothetical protein E2986_11795 [Frieseomelitta varia]|uniref:Dynamin-type G domain-containing protein n=1 Tax=Frieseomelitta varia TaxID=561572 RepID=A0A833RWK7_9HYME|nr:hypothetical protein E2986_11795 [Frieseomelitta varia]
MSDRLQSSHCSSHKVMPLCYISYVTNYYINAVLYDIVNKLVHERSSVSLSLPLMINNTTGHSNCKQNSNETITTNETSSLIMSEHIRQRPSHNRRLTNMSIRVTVSVLVIIIGSILFAYAAFASTVDPTDDQTSLRQEGMLRMYNVGQWIRNEYGSIIGNKYESDLSLIESSYADRCIMSAQALLAALYPPTTEEIFVPGLIWRPVPVHSTPRHLDKIIVVKYPCPRLERALNEAYVNESTRPGTTPSAKYYEELSKYTGENISTITDVEFLYNTLEIEERNGLKLPEWTSKYYNWQMREIAARSLAIFTSNTLQQRLRGGPLLKEILKHLQAFNNGQDTRRAYLYSAHDITLVNLLRTMGFTDEYFKPDYGSTIIFELHAASNSANTEIKLKYLNNTEPIASHYMSIPKCGTPCLLKTLTKLWENVIPNDWDAECLLTHYACIHLSPVHQFQTTRDNLIDQNCLVTRTLEPSSDEMFSWLGRDDSSKQDIFENVADGLKKIYKSKLLPLEQHYQFHDFHSPQLDDPDFDAKPMILLVGQYSTGKTTFIKYLLERDFPGIRIGPEPTTDRFIAVMYHENERVIPGNALVVDPNKQFRPLSKFGNAFLNRFQCSTVASPVLKGISIVDTPGILSGEKQRVDRGYDFTGVMEWFAERVDRIILLFDAHKLDISDEFRRLIEALRGHDDKIRIVLNKADMIDHQQLMRVYGALMWSLGKVLQTPEVARVYIGSFWDQPLRYDVNKRLFEDEEQDLFRDMQSLPRNAALRKLNDLIKRARLAKVHAYIISALRKDMPSMFGKDTRKKELIKNLGQIYDQIQREQQISPGDFPDLKKMQESLAHHDFSKFNSLKPKLLEVVDNMLVKDIAQLMAMIPHEEVSTTSDSLARNTNT